MYAQQSELVRHRSSCALLSLFPRSSPSSCASLSPARARDLFVAAPVSSATAFAPQLLTSHLSPVPPSAHWTRAPQKRSFFSSPADSAPRPEATSAPFEDFDFTFRTLRRRRWRPPRTVSPIAVPRPAAPSSAGAESPSAPPEGSDHGGDEAAEAPERALPYGYSTLAELEGRWVRLALKNVLTRTRPRRGGGPPSPSALASRFADESIEGPASKAMRRDVSGEQRPPEMKPLTLLAEAPTLAESLAFLREPRETSTEAPGDTAGTAGLVREGDEGTEGERARALEVDAADEAFEVAADEPDGDASDEVASGLPEGAFARGDGRDALDVEAELGVYVHPKWSRTIEKLERLLPRMAVHDVCLCLRYLAQASLLEHRVALGCIYTLRQKAEDLTAREIGVLCDFLNKPFFRRAAQQLAKGDSEPVPGRESSGLNPARRSDPPPQAAALASRGARDGCSGAAGRRRRSDDAACEETAPLRRGQEWHASDVLDAKARRRALKRQRLADLVAEQELTLRKLRQLVRAKCHDLQHANDVCSVLWTFHAHGLLSASLLGTVRRLLLQRLRGSPEPNPEVPSSASSSPSSQAFRNSLLPRHMASLVAFFLRTGLLDRELFRALTSACLSEASASRLSAAPPSSTPPAATRAGAPAGFVGDGSAESADAKKARTRQEQKLGVWLAARLQGKDLLRLSEGLVAVTAASPLSLLASSSAASPVAEFYGGDDEELRSRAEEYTLAMALQIAAVRKHRSLSGSALSTLLFYSATLASQLPGVCVLPELAYRASTHLAWRTSEFSLSAQAQFLSALPALSAVLPPDPLLVSALADSLSSSLLSLSAPASPSPPSPAGALPLLSLSWAAVASLLALYQRSAASHAVAAAAERIRRRHYLDLFLLLSAPTSSRCLPCGKPPPAALHSASSPPLPMDSDPPPALSAEARLCVEYGGADGDRNASGDAFASCSAHSAMGIGELRLADNRHERVHGQLPALAATASSSLEYLDPPPLPASLLQQAQAEQHLLSLRDALEAATEALAASQLPAGGAGSADTLASAQSRVQAASSVRTSHVSGAKEALPTLVQVVLWSQIAAASCASQASERVLRSAFRCLRRLLGAPETAAALAGSCRAAATAVVGLQSPDTQTASGLGARLACLAALWQNVSLLRCRDSGVLYPLVEAADAFAEARADARQPAMPGDAFGKPRQENGKREEDLLTAVSVDILLSACELQALDLLSECTRRALLQTAVNRLSSLSTGSLLSLLQSALLCTADAEARAGVGGASDAPALSAQRLPVSACGSGGAAAPPLVPHNPDSITLAGSPLSPAPSRQSAAEAYGQLLPCVMREAATRFQAGGYIPPASHLPLFLLARRFLLAPCFSSLLARRGAGGVGGGVKARSQSQGAASPWAFSGATATGRPFGPSSSTWRGARLRRGPIRSFTATGTRLHPA
ncbi:hypothetical protein BESB_012380 [Besnoitia besnoiti]|uniref:Uncharacterized protein n=1 Tax=Besnoitia besnoiti TaxID=94643 RepID=A0A2A9M9M5_BESBE|nr:hypothetical protein BESB_012380 [Besnoitia besnoiti]PFH32626.1 hypothetical protein BESB_012380 [Besnoitia besnoiti]